MGHVLTLVSSDPKKPLTEKHFKRLAHILGHYNIDFSSDIIWLKKKKAAEAGIPINASSVLIAHIADELAKDRIDFFITKNENRQKKLLLADMDSTIASTETLDELAAYVGIKDQVSEITARAMNGELDFHNALRERVGLLKGLEETALQATLSETELNPGAIEFVKTMRENGATCVLVSGGFTHFTSAIGAQCDFHHNHGNTLEIMNNKLTGNVVEPILDKHAKVDFLNQYIEELGITYEDCLTIGDGANDLPMLKKAGLGIGYHAKPSVREELTNNIRYGDLTAALYAQGINEKHFVKP